MELPIISTKLNTPGLSSFLLIRPGLNDLLDAGLGRKLTLLSAPAGFGKSTLAAAWSSSKTNIGWLSLDESDNDPVSFFSHFFTGFRKLNSSLGRVAISALRDRDSLKYESLIISLINEISELDDSVLFVLDDYHVISNSDINSALQLLIDRMPSQLHLFILTRSDPPFSLSRLRSSEQICEIRAEDLEFDINETEAYLNDKYQLNIKSDDISLLHKRTEGWIAGLQLSAFSLNKSEDKSGFVRALSGDDRYIADYLTEEVLNSLPPSWKTFLLKISILNRICGPLADSVTGGRDGNELLTLMERDNLFLIPLDNHREWFRLHHLFADLLRQRIGSEGIAAADLHCRASDWFDENGYPVEAIDHAIEARDADRITRLSEKYANEFLMRRGETKQILRWLEKIPEDLITSSARLSLTYAWVLFYEFELERIEPYLENVGRLVDAGDQNDLRAEYETVMATLAVFKRDVARSVELYKHGLSIISPDNDLIRGMILMGLGFAYISTGQLSEAEATLEQAGSVNRNNGNISISLKAYCFAAISRILEGKITGARQAVETVLNIAREFELENAPIMSVTHSILAELEREANNLAGAADSASRAIELAETHSDKLRLFSAYMVMAEIKDAQESFKGALSYIRKAEELINRETMFLSTFRSASAKLRILMKMDGEVPGEVKKPDDQWLSVSGAIMIPGQVREYEHLTYVRYLISEKEYGEAEKILDFLAEKSGNSDRVKSSMEILLHRTLLMLDRGYREKAKSVLTEVLDLSEKTGINGLLMEFSGKLNPLVEELSGEKCPVSREYLNRLSAMMKTVGRKKSTPELVVPLSDRELEVLQLLDTNMTNREIAEKLFVSINTLKTHIKSINNKLDTANRSEVKLKAREIGLL